MESCYLSSEVYKIPCCLFAEAVGNYLPAQFRNDMTTLTAHKNHAPARRIAQKQ
jgi:hypothetical protein